MEVIKLTALNYEECARYLGYKGNTPDENILMIMKECEEEIKKASVPRYVFRKFPVKASENGVEVVGTDIVLTGNSIKLHLKNCNFVY